MSSSSSKFVEEKLRFLIPESDQQSFKTAVYTGGVCVFLGLCGVGLWATYHLLLAFVKPILWAILAGTVLFPLKQSVTDTIRGWLKGLRDSGTPLLVGVVVLPFKGLDSASQRVWDLVASKTIFFVIGGYAVLTIFTLEGVFVGFVRKISGFMLWLDRVMDVLNSNWVTPIFLLYFVVYVGWLYLDSAQGGNKKLARILSIPIWLFVLTYISGFFGPFQPIVLLVSAALVALIAVGVISAGGDGNGDTDAASDQPEEPTQKSPAETSATQADPNADPTETKTFDKNLGNTYLKGIFGACVLLWSVKHGWVLLVLFVPLMFAVVKKTGYKLGVWELLASHGRSGCQVLSGKLNHLIDTAVPSTIRGFFRILFHGDQSVWLCFFSTLAIWISWYICIVFEIVQALEKQMDLLSSVVVMLFMVVAGIILSFFIVVQIHGEVVHLVRLGGSVLSAEDGTVMGAVNFTGTKLSEHDIDSYVDDAYKHGRTWLTAKVRTLADPSDTNRADKLEEQVTILMDRLYEMWQTRDVPDYIYTNKHELTNIWSLSTFDYTQIMAEVQQIVTENIGTLQTIMTSVWSVVSANLMFLSSLFGAFAIFILSFFMELLNLVIETVVFLTVLYYLLASSTTQWKPLEWMSMLSPAQKMDGTGGEGDGEGGMGVSKAVEEAISGVFELSGKMCIFYGLYTWFMHSLFDLNVVFVPSLLAALLAAVPLAAPYTVSLLGFFELWLVRGELPAALLFLIASISPMMFADAAFYSEVKGSHPYVTGLAIVGGIYWMGLEGAIIGPIILCTLLVLFKLLASVRSTVQ